MLASLIAMKDNKTTLSDLKRVVAETTKDNQAMITVFKKLGFDVNYNQDTTVSISKVIN